MDKIQILDSDVDTLKKILNKEIDANDLPEKELTRLIRLCQYQKDNLDRRLAEKERNIKKLENKLKKYKNGNNS